MNNATIIPTGSSEHTKANNIYDLAGNVYEWTIEGNGWNYRCYRGGNVARYSNDIPAAERGSFYPDYIDEYFGCRAYLYIK